jgi:hypothetical protein
MLVWLVLLGFCLFVFEIGLVQSGFEFVILLLQSECSDYRYMAPILAISSFFFSVVLGFELRASCLASYPFLLFIANNTFLLPPQFTFALDPWIL